MAPALISGFVLRYAGAQRPPLPRISLRIAIKSAADSIVRTRGSRLSGIAAGLKVPVFPGCHRGFLHL